MERKKQELYNIDISNVKDSFLILLTTLGFSLISFPTARYSVMWVLQYAWQVSGDFWQGIWHQLYHWAKGDEFTLAVVIVFLVSSTFFWVLNALLVPLDLTGKPRSLTQYKIQQDKNAPVDPWRLLQSSVWVVFNQTVVLFFSLWAALPLVQWRGCDFGPTLPSFPRVIFEIAIFLIMEDIFFYYSHRLLHHPLLYKHIHKRHHEWTAPVSIVALYCHPLEHFISNLLPGFMGPFLLGSHVALMTFWFTAAMCTTTLIHSGYHFPLLPSPEFHDYHHLKFMYNFGAIGLLDWLHGTDSAFKASKAYQRHRILWTSKPLSKQYPD